MQLESTSVRSTFKSYLIRKIENKSIKSNKRKYKNEFASLFEGHYEMVNKIGYEKIEWNDFTKYAH